MSIILVDFQEFSYFFLDKECLFLYIVYMIIELNIDTNGKITSSNLVDDERADAFLTAFEQAQDETCSLIPENVLHYGLDEWHIETEIGGYES